MSGVWISGSTRKVTPSEKRVANVTSRSNNITPTGSRMSTKSALGVSKIMASFRTHGADKENEDAKRPVSVRMQRFDSNLSARHLGVARGTNGEEEKVDLQRMRNGRRPTVAVPRGRQNMKNEHVRVPQSVRIRPGDGPVISIGSMPSRGQPADAISEVSAEENPMSPKFFIQEVFNRIGIGKGQSCKSEGRDEGAEGDMFVVDEVDMKQLFEKYGGKLYRAFPTFRANRYHEEYQHFQRTFFSLPSAVLMLAVVTVVILNTNYLRLADQKGHTAIVRHEGQYFRASLALFCIWFIFAAIYIIFMALGPAIDSVVPVADSATGAPPMIRQNSKMLSRIHLFRKAFESLWIGRNIENILGLSIAVVVGLRMTTFVYDVSDCVVSDPTSGGCTEVLFASTLPSELVLSVYLIPIAAQMVFKGMDIRSVGVSWLMSMIFLIVSYCRLNDGWEMRHIWELILATLFLFVVIEYERFVRLSFVHSKVHNAIERARLLAVDEKNSQVVEANRRWMDQKLHMEKADMERKSVEQESAQLRSLIGNVAHDLKTPLQSMAMGMEVLKSSILASSLCPAIAPGLDDGTAQGGEPFDAEEAVALLDSLVVTGSFMSMAINRAVDFTKATSGIALVPSYVTFDIYEALEMPIACINNVQSSISIVVERLPWNICPTVISDRHWFCENILCLLSNAVKYCEGGCVTVAIEHLPRDQSGKSPSASKSKLEDASEYSTVKVAEGPMIRVIVEDTGIGIAPEMRKSLFRPFKQAQRMTGGTGLGLYSLAKRIEALEGMYGIDDRRDGGKGCGIWFAFPYRPDYTMAAQASFYGIGGASIDSPSAVRSGSFLNIDDSTEQRSALSSHQSSRVSLFLPLTGESDDSNSSSGLSRVPTAPRILEAVRSGMIRNSSVQDPHVRRQDLPPVMEGRKESREGSIADADDASDSVPTPACSLRAKDKDHRDDTAHNYASTASLGGSELLHSPGERQGLRILLVDDALSILKVAGKSLTLKGHSVETAQNGSIALERLKKSLIESADKAGHRDFDFVLIDLQMPVMDGFEAVRRYREFENKFYEEHPDLNTDAGKYARHQLIIGASANSDSVSRQGALDAGMDFFVPKPYTYNDLLPILRAEGFAMLSQPPPSRVNTPGPSLSLKSMEGHSSKTIEGPMVKRDLHISVKSNASPTSAEYLETKSKAEEVRNALESNISGKSNETRAEAPVQSTESLKATSAVDSGGNASSKKTTTKSLSILLVDDALSILKVAGKALQLKGHKVTTAQNGSIALNRLVDAKKSDTNSHSGERFDFVLIDLQMPVMDGFEAVRRYREFENKFYEEHPDLNTDAGKYARHQLIIGASANSDSVSRQGALDAGMDFFVPKPYTYNDLLPILRAEGFIDC